MIEPHQLDRVILAVEENGLDEALIARLRGEHPGVHFTCCSDDDIAASARAVAERPAFNVYLVNSSSHCLALTNDLDAASGMVLAYITEA
ncbi:MAG TPA: DUF6129 family protein [Pseudomonas sp.]|jgi:hypothetical protein|uniref:DUF6129 family protein n=1 Tax=Pseudomonas sp. TaxID=306 RepID=UPI002ED981B7